MSEPLPLRKPVAWVTGAGGLIGSYLVRTVSESASRWQIRALTRADLDLTDHAAVARLFHREAPNLVIHCAALSKTGACESNPQLAHQLNVATTDCLADLAGHIPFFFFSTDLVFDGQAGHYDEAAPVNPLGVYGETKVAAEEIVRRNPRHTVLRTSLNGGISPTGDRGFNEEIRKAWQDGREITLFIDEYRCPLPASITALAVWELAALDRPGLFHLAGGERYSRWQIGTCLAARWPHLEARIRAATLKEFKGAPRSPDTSLNCAKLQELLSFSLPALRDWLEQNPTMPF